MTKDDLENELDGAKSMLAATEKAYKEAQEVNLSLLDQVQALESNQADFDFLLRHGLQLDYDMRTLTYRPKIDQFVLQNHRQTEYVEGRGTIASETLYVSSNEALTAFINGNTRLSP